MDREDARARLRELADFATPWAVSIAATLRLPDKLEGGPLTAAELAERVVADPDSLGRLLRYLVAVGVLAEEGGKYANTELSRFLVDENGWPPWLDLDGAPGIWAESWANLLTAVRTGSPGRGESWYYEELARTGRGESFDSLMARQAGPTADAVARTYDWSGTEHVVDVGGGNGTLLRVLLAANPHLRGTLVDLPQVVAAAEPAERLEIVAGDLFESDLPRGDAYVLSQILHGWPDEAAERILRRCAEAGGAQARILVVEGVLAAEPSVDDVSFDLFMLALVGGRQRSLDEFGRLAEAAGLALRASYPLETVNTLVELAAK